MIDRLKNEPALVVAVILAVANLVAGKDLGLDADTLESAVVLVGGWLVRQRVTPLAKTGDNVGCC